MPILPRLHRFTPAVLAVAVVAIALCAAGLLKLGQANAGIVAEPAQLGPTPVTVFRPDRYPVETPSQEAWRAFSVRKLCA